MVFICPAVISVRITFVIYQFSDVVVSIDSVSSAETHVNRLASALRNKFRNTFRRVITIFAKVPICRFVHSSTGLGVDVSFNQDNGPEHTRFPLLLQLSLSDMFFTQLSFIFEGKESKHFCFIHFSRETKFL
jgi:DNA polymerase sigma